MPVVDPSCIADLSKLDERIWQNSVKDLHKVMETIMRVWLLLKHANEPLVRVAVEILTSPYAREILSWPDRWWPDEEKRTLLKRLVQGHLKNIMQYLKPGAVLLDEGGETDVGTAAAEQRAREWEERFLKSEQARRLLELNVKEEEELRQNAEQRQLELEEALQRLREELQPAQTLNGGEGRNNSTQFLEIKNLKEKIASLEQQLRFMKDKNEQGVIESERTPNLVRHGHGVGATAVVEKRLSGSESKLKMLEDQVSDLQRKLRERECELAAMREKQTIPSAVSCSESDDPEVADLKTKLKDAMGVADAAQKRVIELEDALDLAQARLLEAEARAAAAEKKIETSNFGLSSNPQESPGESGQSQPTNGRGMQKKDEELARLNELLKQQCEQNGRLREKNAELEEQHLHALEMIRKLKAQLEKLKEVAEKRGHGKLLQELMEESGLAETLGSGEFTVFDRLYEDALRRMAKINHGQTLKVHPYQRKGTKDRGLSPSAHGDYKSVSGRASFSGKYWTAEHGEPVGDSAGSARFCPMCGSRQPASPMRDGTQRQSLGLAQLGDGVLDGDGSNQVGSSTGVGYSRTSAQPKAPHLSSSHLDGQALPVGQRPLACTLSATPIGHKRPTSGLRSSGLSMSCPIQPEETLLSRRSRPGTASTPDLTMTSFSLSRIQQGERAQSRGCWSSGAGTLDSTMLSSLSQTALSKGSPHNTEASNVVSASPSNVSGKSRSTNTLNSTLTPTNVFRPESGRPTRSSLATRHVVSAGSFVGKRAAPMCW